MKKSPGLTHFFKKGRQDKPKSYFEYFVYFSVRLAPDWSVRAVVVVVGEKRKWVLAANSNQSLIMFMKRTMGL